MISEGYLSKGFFTFAQNTNKVDYLKLAYLQALSIKHSQKQFNQYAVGITKGMQVPEKYLKVFDYVLEIPWEDDAQDSDWKLENEWKAVYMSPFEMTVKLDSDMLFFSDMRHWWYLYSQLNLAPTLSVLDFRGNRGDDSRYRSEVKEFNLPNFYSGLFYFRKCDDAFKLFDMVRTLYPIWDSQIRMHLYKDYLGKHASTDIAFALASKILGLVYPLKSPTFVHMKKSIQDTQGFEISEIWTKSLKYHFDKEMRLYIENYRQTYPVHYYLKEFASDVLIRRYETILGL